MLCPLWALLRCLGCLQIVCQNFAESNFRGWKLICDYAPQTFGAIWYNMWHKGMNWLCMCQSHVQRMARQLSWWQQMGATLTWSGSWWSSTEQTCITSQRWVVQPSVCDSECDSHLSYALVFPASHRPLKFKHECRASSIYSLIGREIALPVYIILSHDDVLDQRNRQVNHVPTLHLGQ